MTCHELTVVGCSAQPAAWWPALLLVLGIPPAVEWVKARRRQ